MFLPSLPLCALTLLPGFPVKQFSPHALVNIIKMPHALPEYRLFPGKLRALRADFFPVTFRIYPH